MGIPQGPVWTFHTTECSPNVLMLLRKATFYYGVSKERFLLNTLSKSSYFQEAFYLLYATYLSFFFVCLLYCHLVVVVFFTGKHEICLEVLQLIKPIFEWEWGGYAVYL